MDIQYGNERQKSSNRRLKPSVIHAGTLHMKDTNLTQETRRKEKQLTTMSLYCAHWLQHMNSPRTLNERLLRETDLTLEKFINICRATEASKEQIRSLGDGKPNNIDALKKKSFKKTWKSKSDRDRTQENKHERNFKGKSDKNCGNCGRKHPPKACFVYGKRCNRCQKLGHFQSYCRSKPVEELYYENSDSDNSSEHGIDMVGSREPQTNIHEEHATIRINNKPLTVKLDSGAATNIIPKEEFHRLVPKRQRKQKLKESTAKLTAFGGHDIPVIGKCHLQCRHRGTTHVLEFQVVEQGKSLLGCASSKSMELITFHNVDHLNGQKAEQSADKNTCKIAGLNSDQIFETYSSCFEGLGSISKPYRIKIDDTVNPVIHPPRKLPAALRERVKDKLHAMESQGVIKKVTQPTPWVNSMVENEKRNGDLRICVDLRDLNKAIKREHYQLPTQQEIMARLAGAKYFSKLDAKSGFWQLPLDSESSYLTTFNTPFRRYRFTVVPFGVVFAQEVFHRTIHEKFNDIEGCETDIDDILVWGRTIEEHDQRLEQVLDRAKKIGLTLSADKCEFRRKEITYLGETLTQDGLRPDENKVKAIKDYARPESKQDVQRLLGMVNFIAKFAPKMSDVTAPLRELIKKGIEFHWLETHEQAFTKLKDMLTQPETLKYHDVTKSVTLQVDSSLHGMGAALLQDQGPVAYASKALNETQKKYATIEKELLAVVFACKRFHQYIYGKPIHVESDHKPLQAIFTKPLSQAPSRLQKMLMQLQEYDITLTYKKGTEMYLADALSRAFLPDIVHEQFEKKMDSEKFIHLMSSTSYVTDRKLKEAVVTLELLASGK